MRALVGVGALVLGLALAAPAVASDAGYIYGRVETVEGDQYEGQIRWGDEEAFWDDIFNATKVENENLDYVDGKVLDRMRRQYPWRNLGFVFGNRDEEFTHLFAIRFGDLAGIRVRGGHGVVAEFRNGEVLKLSDGSNDVGARITVADPEQGEHSLQWRRIRTIQFRETPAKLAKKLGDPIYGTVKSRKYEFTGRIQWDHDECLSIDELDGRTEDGKVSIAFGDIASIRKHRQGALVRLKSGRQEYITGTNDVNRSNRGILVKMRDASVKIGWDDFEEVTFTPAPNTGLGYEEYGPGRELMGAVTSGGHRYKGRIVFDLDESWDFELLHGKEGSTEYLIPFREIVRITPKGLDRSEVELRSGLTVELEESQDVSRKNDGLLVFADNREPKYVAWRDIDEVVFRER